MSTFCTFETEQRLTELVNLLGVYHYDARGATAECADLFGSPIYSSDRLWQWSAGLIVSPVPRALHYARHFKSTLGQWPNANCAEVITGPRPSTLVRGN